MDAEERPLKIRKLDPVEDDKSIDLSQGGTDDKIEADLNDGIATWQGNDEDTSPADPPLSKNALKKLRKQQEWEAARDYRLQRRKDKRIAVKERKKQERKEAREAAANEPEAATTNSHRPRIDVPVTILIDCDFDKEMLEKEIVSISSQITRCYSENRKARYRPHLAISSFSGRLKARFENVGGAPHERWHGVKIEGGDFVEVAEKAKAEMIKTGSAGIKKCAALEHNAELTPDDGEVIYLTADSDHTLEELRPYSTYILGGIVDRNRHKGICYKRAKDRGVKTAKLPIGEFLRMNSRVVLATNHVYEIMLKWLECKDWGEAFMHVIPKRKGGVLKGKTGVAEDSNDDIAGKEDEPINEKSEERLFNGN